jgi:hypothetical protein
MTRGPRGEISGRQTNSPGLKFLIAARTAAGTARLGIRNELAAKPNAMPLRVNCINAFVQMLRSDPAKALRARVE